MPDSPLSFFAEVVVSGPWWNKLTYLSERKLPEGVRVYVKVGKSKRVGFVSHIHNDKTRIDFDISKLKPIESVLDASPPLPPDLWKLSEWIGRVYFCGQGEAISVVCPSELIKGIEVEPINNIHVNNYQYSYHTDTVFIAADYVRYKKYIDIIKKTKGPSIALFPEQVMAKRFFALLPDDIKSKALLWPSGGTQKIWNTWNYAKGLFEGLIVGSQRAAFAPLYNLSLIIVDEESSGGYVQQKFPFLNVKSIAAKRADLSGCELILGGRLPSSKVYINTQPTCNDKIPDSRFFLVDIRASLPSNISGIVSPFRISETALRETGMTLKSDSVALWILDRKGYAGEVACEECGRSIECAKCGGIYNWDNISGTLKCSLCGAEIPFPDECPYCRGTLIIGKRAGIDALYQVASKIFISDKPVVKWHSDFPRTKSESAKIRRSLAKGGLVVGSRLALSLCDTLPVTSVTWIDADSEARKPFYNSHFKAFSMIWESCWRGPSYENRSVVIQSRMPGKGWQRGLSAGWEYFWKMELAERRELNLPPYAYLLQVDFPDDSSKMEIISALEKSGLDIMDPGHDKKNSVRIWISTARLNPVMTALEPFFRISRSAVGFPLVSIYSD